MKDKLGRMKDEGQNGDSSSTLNPQPSSLLALPTIDELKRAYEEGLPQTLLSGLQVVMRPVQPDKLLMAGNVPDILTPLLMNMMFPPAAKDERVFPDEEDSPVTAYLSKQRQEARDAVEFIKSIDVVCEAALIDPSLVPYLSLPDRMWIFKLAWMPVEVLSTFRLQPQRDVEAGDDSGTGPQQTEPVAAVGGGA